MFGKQLDEEHDLFSRKSGEMESWDLLFFIEIKPVQNSVGKRGHD